MMSGQARPLVGGAFKGSPAQGEVRGRRIWRPRQADGSVAYRAKLSRGSC